MKIRNFLLLVLTIITLDSCTSYTELVRTKYQKISSLRGETNYQKFGMSSFNNFTIYKANLQSDFDLKYFWSFRYYRYVNLYMGSYTIDIAIYSSLLHPGDSFIQMGNPFHNHYTETTTGINLLLYLLSEETILSKKYYFEMEIDDSVLSSPGIYKSDGSKMPVSLSIKNRNGQTLFTSSEGTDSFLNFEVVEIEEDILYGIYSGKLGSISTAETIYYDIYDGEIWIKL
ncbi:MAG TPA: hypothetical protein ENI27_10690 [bacterium]|nr:hypothetical protein [bacterium]